MNIFKPRSNTDSIPFCVSEAVSTVPVMLAAMSSSSWPTPKWDCGQKKTGPFGRTFRGVA